MFPLAHRKCFQIRTFRVLEIPHVKGCGIYCGLDAQGICVCHLHQMKSNTNKPKEEKNVFSVMIKYPYVMGEDS